MRFGRQFQRRLLSMSMILTVAGTAQGHSNSQYHPEVEQTNRIAWSLKQVLSTCPDRIWPNLQAKNLDVLLVQKDLQKQILISPTRGTISSVPNDQVPEEAFHSTFSPIELHGRSSMYMNMNMKEHAYATSIHEAFHWTDQTTWVRRSGSRGSTLPLLAEPRIARSMIYRNLHKAYFDKSNSETYLGQAKFWFDEWKRSDPQEIENTTDGYEGTAQYVDHIASALDARGCGAPEKEMEAYLKDSDIMKGEWAVGRGSFDGEGYFIGGLASLILRFQYPQIDWQSRVIRGETPLEILLEKRQAISEAIDEVTAKELRATIVKKNQEVEVEIAEGRESLRDPGSIYVVLPYTAMQGSFSPKGFYSDRATGIGFTPMAIDLPFVFKTPNTHLKSLADAVFIQTADGGGCGFYGWGFLVKSSELRSLGNEIVSIDAPHFKGVIKGAMKDAGTGRLSFCAQE